MAITAAMVKELREMTGAGMMDCKKALNETNGNMDEAVEFLRKNGQAKAEKKASRIAAEGLCTVVVKDDTTAAVVEVNSETDFVAKNETFQSFVKAVAAQAVNSDAKDMDAFMAEAWNEDASKTVNDALVEKVAVIGENLKIRRFEKVVATIMPCVSLFSRRNPDVNFEVHDGITYTLYRYLMDGIIDISIARTPLRLDDVDYKILSSEPMIAVSSKDMLPEKNGSLKLSDLLNIPLIIYRRYEALIMDAFHSRGMEPDLFCVCDDPRGAMLWAKEGLATAIFPQSMSSLCQGLRIQPLAESDLETQIAVIWKKGRKLSPLLQDFVDACMESIL